MTPGLSYYWEGAREQCEDNEWDEGKRKESENVMSSATFFFSLKYQGMLVTDPGPVRNSL